MVETAFKRHEPLYLKYRPQSLSQLVGQESVTRTLTNAINNDRLSHAYLFTGPRGTGKTSSARILAKSLNCKTAGRPTAEPCQTCSCCIEITLGNSPAVFEIDAASNNSVDDARTLIERAPLKAVGGEFKVYIIDECHMLTKEAFNALLKTIEQPPPGVVFILATTEEHKVLPTIVSRCQRLMFRLINQDALTGHLRYVADSEEIAIEDDALRLIARRSGGGLRDALSNLDQASLLASADHPVNVPDLLRLLGALHEDVLLRLSKHISERQGQDVINAVSELLGEGREPAVVLQELSRHFLNLMKASYLSGTKEANADALSEFVLGSENYVNGLLGQTDLFERAELSQIIEHLDRLEQTCKRTSQPAMHLEIGLLSICHRHDIFLLKDLLKRVEALEQGLSSGAEPARRDLSRPQASQPQPAPVARQEAPRPAPQYSAPPQQSYNQAPPASPVQAQEAPSYQAPAASSRASEPQSTALMDDGGADELSISIVPESRAAARPPAPAAAPAAESETGSAELSSASAGDPRIAQLNSDLDYVWQQVLDQLQRRHLPTYSLAFSHAFPLAVSHVDFTVGVLKENFQKMLESKVEHLKWACQQVTGMNLQVKVRVSEASAAPEKRAAPARTQPERGFSSGQSTAERNSDPENARPDSVASNREASSSPEPSTHSSSDTDEVDGTMLKEAYKLFEGPGSRRIT